jgi:hypothetical protein
LKSSDYKNYNDQGQWLKMAIEYWRQ